MQALVFLHASTEVASTLFYRLSYLCFTYSQFVPTSLFASASASASARAFCRYYRSHVRSYGCFIPVPLSIDRCRRTDMTSPHAYLPPLTCWLKSSDTVKNPLPLVVGSAPLSPPPLTLPPLSLHPLSPPLFPPPRATLCSCPHRLCHSPICPPHNQHRPGRHTNQHPRTRWRRHRLALCPRRFY